MMRRIAFWIVLVLPTLGARFTVDHTERIVRLADPQISPDGRRVAVVVSRANLEDNRYEPRLMLVDVATREQSTLVRDRAGLSQPRWSPSGDRLAFLANVDSRPQVFILPMSGGEAWQLTKSPTAVQHYAWRPDGAVIAFVAADEPPKRTGAERHNRSFEVRTNDFLRTSAPTPSHLWVIPAEGGAARRVTSGEWSLPMSLPPSSPSSPISWSPDGKRIACVKVASPYSGDGDQSAVQIVDVETGVPRALTGRSRNESQPVISPDGRQVAFWYPRDGETRNVNEIHVASIEGGEGTSVTRAIDRNVQRAIWTADSKSLLVSANDGTTVGVWVQPLAGAARRLDLGRIVPAAAFWLDASLNARGDVAFIGSDPARPVELYVTSTSPGAKPSRLTGFNDEIAALELGRTETVVWDGADGYRQDGVVTYPPGFVPGRKYPLLLFIHGGPRSASKEAFSARAQLFAAQGWVIFEPNYRGSDNLGNAFQAAIWNDAGAGPGRDVMSGVEYLKKRGFVDETRMGVSGWSYGGFMTTWLLGNYPDRWKAAVAGAAVTDWMDQYNLGDANVRRGRAMGGSPWTDPARRRSYAEQSPITYAPRIKAPTLVLCNTGDYRVPITQSYQLYRALVDNKIPTQFIAYPLPGHSPADPVHSRDVSRRWVEWLARYLGDGAAARPSGE
jgi:dipeptidyl aminopeptidase/acylaminoacyl peptidase